MRYLIVLMVIIAITGCGSNQENQPASQSNQTVSDPSGLSGFEVTHGIGPVKKPLSIGPISKELASQGAESFETKCSACHKLDERYIGPALRYVADRRSNEYILNMILNPDEMAKRHPEGQKLLGEYLSPMPFQNVSEAEAKALLDYLRLMAQEGKEKKISAVPVYPSH